METDQHASRLSIDDSSMTTYHSFRLDVTLHYGRAH